MYCGAYIISVLSFSFVGFVDKNYSFAPPVGFNLTFTCPAGQVFESDWLAVPFVMMTCQVKTVKYNTKNLVMGNYIVKVNLKMLI